jgi:hypothetical protein
MNIQNGYGISFFFTLKNLTCNNNNEYFLMLGVFDKLISNIGSKCPPKISEFIETNTNNRVIIHIFIIMIAETESTKCQPVDI